jgi:hypothetical protein
MRVIAILMWLGACGRFDFESAVDARLGDGAVIDIAIADFSDCPSLEVLGSATCEGGELVP